MAKSLAERLGRRVRDRREAANLTQASLAERAGLSVNYVSAVERGAKVPSLPALEDLARALGVAPGTLLGPDSKDAWLDELVSVAESVPRDLRPVAIAVLKAVAKTSR